ncbi:uncharacterized protein N7482_005972 [Penicillium canariense]|uniref:Uncharacterized protein n=1 Tax=Penicillium canariense TaxID=189055 RepID=A0A9W9I4Z4_9EURO|nr:uncharacterized protein N7482_005972 [Penicillium canariense]KAJ5167191.1 hypothetical protein N7482_005972 [Penicillium canariense]
MYINTSFLDHTNALRGYGWTYGGRGGRRGTGRRGGRGSRGGSGGSGEDRRGARDAHGAQGHAVLHGVVPLAEPAGGLYAVSHPYEMNNGFPIMSCLLLDLMTGLVTR